jgi:hypothetical protein
LYGLIDKKRKNIANPVKDKSNSTLSPRKDLLDLLISEKDPETGRKFQDEKVCFILYTDFINHTLYFTNRKNFETLFF